MGPLSAKQHREYLKLQAEEQRKEKAFALDQQRKNQLFGIKLQEQATKASQSIGHKEDAHKAKMKEMGVPPLRMNKQKLGLPTMNPLAGMEVFKQGQHKLANGTDTVPAMLTPGEAVIPAPAAQNPKNKKAIKKMVAEGRQANRKMLRDGTVNLVKTDSPVPRPTAGTYGGVPQQVQQAAGYMNGTHEVPNVLGGVTGVAHYADGTEEVSFLDKILNKIAGQKPEVPAITQEVPMLPEPILQAQRMVESNNMNVYPEGSPKAGQLITSPRGALGIAQIMPSTAANPGFGLSPISIEDLKDSNKAIKFQGDYMSAMSNRYGGDVEKALTAYNAGPGSVDKAVERANRAGKPQDWKNFLPTQEAKDYANKVMSNLTGVPAKPAQPGTGFYVSESGAAFGNPNVTREAAKSVPRQQAIAEGRYQAVPNIAETAEGMQEVVIPSTRFDIPKPMPEPKQTSEISTPTVEVSNIPEKDTRALDAMIAGFSQQVAPQIQQAVTESAKLPEEEKKNFLERMLSNVYGKEGLFNEKDLARFVTVAAGGLLTGGSVGGSLRFAAKDTLLNADKRSAVESQREFEKEKIKAIDDRTERNKLIDQGYELSNIDKYIKSRQVSDLGEPKTTYSFKETGKQLTVDRGPMSGMVFQVVEATTKTGKGTGDTTLMVVDPRNGNKIPLSSFQASAQKIGQNVVDYSSATHSPTARANRVKEWVEKDASTVAEQSLEQEYGASNIKGKPNAARSKVPPSSVIAGQAASFFKSIGFEPSDPNEMLEGKNIMNVAVQDMINDQQSRKVKVPDITPYLSRSMITVRSGINPDLFKIGVGDKAKLMLPEKIVQLDYLVKQASANLSGGQTNQAAQQALYQRMANAWNSDPKLREKYGKPGSEESSFYMFMKDTLTQGLKD